MKTFPALIATLFLFSLCGRAQSDTTIRIYFDFASWEPNGRDPFRGLDTNRWERTITLEARTDTTGSFAYNRDLADFRLQAVRQLLQRYPYFRIDHAEIVGEDYKPAKRYRPAQERCVIVELKAKVPGRLISRSPVSVGQTSDPIPVERAERKPSERMPRSFHPDSAMVTGDVLILRNIEFLINETVVTLESYPELQQLAKVMKDHPTMYIHIRGHVCCAPAQSLSDQRALKVYTYLVSNGIEPERMTYKGYSNKIPNPEAKTDLFSQEHRRVEIEVVRK